MSDQIEVKLYPHKGTQRVGVGDKVVEMEVDHHQCIVHCNGTQVGWYCGDADQPGKYLSFIVAMPLGLQAEIAKRVAEITGGVGTFSAPPPDEHEVSDE